MAVREYVGARYVPNFTGLYDNTRIYDALDVVDNGSGTSYIAKKTVPAGTPLTDTDYWFVYGASSGAIINLQNQINGLDTRVDHLELLSNRYFLLIGDSLGAGYTPGVGPADRKGWEYYTKERIEAAGGRCFMAAAHGGGFGCANDWYTNISTDPDIAAIKDEITDVVILGGTNDIAVNDVTYSMLTTGIDTFFTWAKEYFPNAQFKLGILTSVLVSVSCSSSRTIQQYRAANRYGVSYLADLENLFSNPDYISADNVHLTQQGYEVLSPYVFDCIINGHTNYKIRCSTTDFTFATKTLGYRFTYTQSSTLLEFLVKTSGGDYLACEVDVTGVAGYDADHWGSTQDFLTVPQYSPLKIEEYSNVFDSNAAFVLVENGKKSHYLGALKFTNLRVDDATSAKIRIMLPVKMCDWGESGTVYTNPARWLSLRTAVLLT